MTVVAEFRIDHAEEQRIAAWDGWENVYKAAFPTLSRCERETDREQQRRGIDRRLFFDADWLSFTVDEKYDKHSTANFFIEITSVAEKSTPGWICGHLECDYIGYMFLPLRCFYVLPYKDIVEVWQRKGDEWSSFYEVREIRNRGYTTLGVPVPRALLLSEIQSCVVSTFRSGQWMRGWADA